MGAIEQLLKENAIDCQLYKSINYNIKDKPYSKICAYQSKCDYNCNIINNT